jgi:hypothetical protein
MVGGECEALKSVTARCVGSSRDSSPAKQQDNRRSRQALVRARAKRLQLEESAELHREACTSGSEKFDQPRSPSTSPASVQYPPRALPAKSEGEVMLRRGNGRRGGDVSEQTAVMYMQTVAARVSRCSSQSSM